MASGKRTGDKQRRVPHALPAAVYNKAADRGSFIASRGNPFYRRHIRQVATRKRALPRETLRRISDADLSELHPKYALARDLFMFSFYTRGMSFVDMIYLRKATSATVC